MKTSKRFTALLCALAMLMSVWIVPQAAGSRVTYISFDGASDTNYTLTEGAVLEEGRSGNALVSTSAGTSYARIDASAINAIEGDFTFSIWCYPAGEQQWSRLYDIGTGTDKYIFLCPDAALNAGKPRFVMKNGGGEQVLDSAAPLDKNKWNSVIVTRENGISKIYINGILSGQTSDITINPSDLGTTTSNYLIKSQYAADPYFEGMVDDFAVYDYAMGESEIIEAAGEAYKRIQNGYVNEYNCHILSTSYTVDGSAAFSLNPASSTLITSLTEATNYTPSQAVLTASMYAVSGTGLTLLGEAQLSLASLKSGSITVTAAASGIPQDTVSIVTRVHSSTDNKIYDTASIPIIDYELAVPQKAPADSDTTTNGAHDPSIVKFEGDDTYYVYSSHHLIFTSEDLINWKKYDFTSIDAKDISKKTYDFITANYSGTTMNATYWAPDVIYMPSDTQHPYWMYISVSCGLGGRNSAISLIKSPTPLFWADSDSTKTAAIEDCGVVFATKESSSYKTNAIDTNIYTDTDGSRYFIWGSFWGGIQGAKLTDEGLVEGVDYTSDAAILSSCAGFGTSLFTQRSGTAGPEGAWMLNNGNYRYMFTSYGWLGSNYNTRIARSALTSPFSEAIGSDSDTSLTDANGISVGGQYTSGSVTTTSGHKLIGSYRLGEGKSSTIEGDDSDYYVSYTPGDAHIYYGPGHNSAIVTDSGESFYVSHIRKDYIEGAAVLQVRKMLYTADGWPVVSPIGYSGEKEQKLPRELICGTYDLASVGQTKMNGSSIKARNFDLPVLSSKITLNEDGTLSDGLGEWSFDGDHTVTITFKKDGDSSKDEFYKSGDVLTMYALLGYNKDEGDYETALTGTNQNHITQFATRSLNTEVYTDPVTVSSPEITVEKSSGSNPVLGFDASGNRVYGGDPAATVIGDTVYLYVGHDTASGEAYVMPNWVCYTSKNMIDWEYKGVVMEASSISWALNKTSAWASQMVPYNGKYYLYYCTWDKTDSGNQSIGVAVADSPLGPFVDKGTPLIKGSVTVPATSNYNDIDPTAWIETDKNGVEHRYLAWGNGKYYMCELNEDMISVTDKNGDGTIDMADIKNQRFTYMGEGNWFTEAPWLYRRQDENGNYYGPYYTFFAQNWREEMAYAVSDDLSKNVWTYKGQLMPPTATSNTNHPSVIDFNQKTYFIYHNGALENGSGFRRSVCIQELEFDEDGNVYPLTETSTGLGGTSTSIKTKSQKYLGHAEFTNPSADGSYPLSKEIILADKEDGLNTAWEIVPGLYEGTNDSYVSIQSVNKPGLYIKADGANAVLTANSDGTQQQAMTFKTVKALDGSDGVSFESVSEPYKYLTASEGVLCLSYATDKDACVFTTGAVSPTPVPTLAPAPTPTPEPTLSPNVSNSFDNETARELSNGYKNQITVTDIEGVTLYISGKDSDPAAATSYWAIASGGTEGNALVMQSGKYVSANRGPRVQFNTPYIPDGGCTVLTVNISRGANQLVRYNDDTQTETGTDISAYFPEGEYTEFKTIIINDNMTYARLIYAGGTLIASDYTESFPVIWGTTVNSTNAKLYFDDLSIVTDAEPEPMRAQIAYAYASDKSVNFTLKNAVLYKTVAVYAAEYDTSGKLVGMAAKAVSISATEQEVSIDYERKSADNTLKLYVWQNMMAAAQSTEVTASSDPKYAPDVYYDFNGDLSALTSVNSLGGEENAPAQIATETGKSGKDGDKALSFGGSGSGGVILDKAPESRQYTISFDVKLNQSTKYTPFILMADYYEDQTTAKILDTDAKWVSIAPQGWQETLTSGPMIWSRDVVGGNSWNDLYSANNNTMKLGEWQNITVTANGASGAIYVDGALVASGNIADVIDGTTKLFIGVNFWDTPLNGAVDNIKIYNRTLNDTEVAIIAQ